MNFAIIAKWYLNSRYSFNLINSSLLFFLTLTLLSAPTVKASASEATNLPKQLDDIRETNPMAQITNVNQLRDVAPTDWAYEALRSLVDRYGCIAG
ncbi:MAG: porin, partial [Pleurocapsa sp.]